MRNQEPRANQRTCYQETKGCLEDRALREQETKVWLGFFYNFDFSKTNPGVQSFLYLKQFQIKD